MPLMTIDVSGRMLTNTLWAQQNVENLVVELTLPVEPLQNVSKSSSHHILGITGFYKVINPPFENLSF